MQRGVVIEEGYEEEENEQRCAGPADTMRGGIIRI